MEGSHKDCKNFLKIGGMHMSVEKNIARLIELLAQKKSIMQKIYEMTVDQRDNIRRENIEVFLGSMRKRQIMMDEIDVLDAEFYRNFVEVKKALGVESLENADASSHPELRLLKDGVAEVLEIVRKVQGLDEQSSAVAGESMERLKNDMKNLQERKSSGRKISNGYAATYRHAQGVFIDNKK